MDRIIDDVYMDMAEAELGINFSDNNSATNAMKVITRANELAERDWKRLWRIFQGQNHNEYVMLLDRVSDPNQDIWAQWFDGTDLRGWWD
jgi:hypothetical protein